jgi:hypothetical protein
MASRWVVFGHGHCMVILISLAIIDMMLLMGTSFNGFFSEEVYI